MADARHGFGRSSPRSSTPRIGSTYDTRLWVGITPMVATAGTGVVADRRSRSLNRAYAERIEGDGSARWAEVPMPRTLTIVLGATPDGGPGADSSERALGLARRWLGQHDEVVIALLRDAALEALTAGARRVYRCDDLA
jgi:hypothetical protein